MQSRFRTTMEDVLGELSALFARMNEGPYEDFLGLFGGDGAVFVAGAGRSGLMLRGFAMRLMHMGKRVHMLGDTVTPAARAGDVLLVGSGSGETESLVAAMRKAGTLDMRRALVTTNAGSTMGGMADVTVTIPAPTPKGKGRSESPASIQPMGNLFEQAMFLFLDGVVMELMRREEKTSEDMFRLHANLE